MLEKRRKTHAEHQRTLVRIQIVQIIMLIAALFWVLLTHPSTNRNDPQNRIHPNPVVHFMRAVKNR